MSLSQKESVNCPHCNASQQVEIHKTVNVTVNPELKARILDNRLNSSNCSECKKEINVVCGFLYHDMEKRIMMNLKMTNDPTDFKESDMSGQLKSNGYILREVFSEQEMIEKIRLFDQSINDKVLSGIKDIFFDSFRKVIGERQLYVFFKTYEKRLFSKNIAFVLFSSPEQVFSAKYNIKNLDKPKRQALFNLDVLRGEDWISVA